MAGDTPPAPPVDPPDAHEYLRTYGRTYTHEALDDRLREAGYPPEVIAAAWDALAADERGRDGDPRYLATFLAIGGALLAILVFGGSAALGFLGASFGSFGQSDVASVYLAYGFAAIAAGIGALYLIRRGRRADHSVLGVIGAIGVAAIVWLAISGLCLTASGGLTL